jgi:DNA-directed RNA polymerase subunit beta
MTPYKKVVNAVVTDEIVYLTADEEKDYYISQATLKLGKKNEIAEDEVVARLNGENVIAKKNKLILLT